jgi:arsenite-transporting ATPase
VSSRCRLILLSGVGGAGTTTVAQATAVAAQGEGLTVELIDASGAVDPDPDTLSLVGSSVGRLFAELGAEPVVAEAWSSLAGVAHLSTLSRILRALASGAVDVVVVDCGDHRRARELVELPSVLERLLDAALTPRLAMWRSTGSAGEAAVFDAVSAARHEVVRMRQALEHPATSLRLVTPPTTASVDRTVGAVSVFALLGVAVDGVVVNRFPRKADGWPAEAMAAAEEALARMEGGAEGVAVWKSTSRVRPVPKGRAVVGPLERVQVLDAEQLTVHLGEDEFALGLPLATSARAAASVGVQEHRLVVAFDGAMRWIDLPPVLRRCQPVRATRTPTGLVVTFAPDPATWRQPAEAS